MKKIIIATACIAASLLSCSTAFAQKFDFDNPLDRQFETKAGRVDANLLGTYYFGFSTLTPTSSVLGTNLGKSFSFGFDFGTVALNINREGTLQFTAALRWTFNGLVNANNYIYENVNGSIIAGPGSNIQLSKMRFDYLGIPIGLQLKVSSFRVFGNVSAEVLTTAKRRYVTSNGSTKENIGGISQFRSCAECGIGYGILNAFARYSITPEFKGTDGNSYRPVTFGLVLIF